MAIRTMSRERKCKKRVMTILLMLSAYVLSYFLLSRSFLAVNRSYMPDDPQIYFMPVMWTGNWSGELAQRGLSCYFYPIWRVDHAVFGVGPLGTHVTTRIKS